MTFLKGLGLKIKNFFSNYEKKEKAAMIAIAVVSALKHAIERKEVVTFVKLTHTLVDDGVLHILQIAVPKVLQSLAVAHRLVTPGTTPQEALDAVYDHIMTLYPEAGVAFWVKLSGDLTVEIMKAWGDKKISIAEAISISQLVFEQLQLLKNK